MDRLKRKLAEVNFITETNHLTLQMWWIGYSEGKNFARSTYDKGIKMINQKFKK